jgi:hypothetical protein
VETVVGVKATTMGELATPVPKSATDRLGVTEELLLTCRVPVDAAAVEGLNVTVSVSVCPEFSVAGKDAGASENPLPVTLTELTTVAVLPDADRVTVLVDVVPSVTLPNTRLEGLADSVEVAATTCSDVDLLDPLSEAVSVTVPEVADGVALTMKVALVAFAATLTEDGSVKAALLLVSWMTSPPVGAAPLSPTLHVSVPEGLIED